MRLRVNVGLDGVLVKQVVQGKEAMVPGEEVVEVVVVVIVDRWSVCAATMESHTAHGMKGMPWTLLAG